MAEDHDVSPSSQQQQHPAQTPTGTQGFFTTLLGPLYSSPHNMPLRGSNVNCDAHATQSVTPPDSFAGGNTTTAAEVNSARLALAPPVPANEHRNNTGIDSGSSHGSNSGSASGSNALKTAGLTPDDYYRLSNSAIAPTDLHKTGMLNTADASTATGTNYNNKDSTTATAANANPLQHGSGACAPHMLGYRQCLEVNPDFKTNCTWALDNYMRCKEDTEL